MGAEENGQMSMWLGSFDEALIVGEYNEMYMLKISSLKWWKVSEEQLRNLYESLHSFTIELIYDQTIKLYSLVC